MTLAPMGSLVPSGRLLLTRPCMQASTMGPRGEHVNRSSRVEAHRVLSSRRSAAQDRCPSSLRDLVDASQSFRVRQWHVLFWINPRELLAQQTHLHGRQHVLDHHDDGQDVHGPQQPLGLWCLPELSLQLRRMYA